MAETFGKTDKGDTIYSTVNIQCICKYQSGSAGTLTSISIYLEGKGVQTAQMKCAIFDNSGNILANGITEEKDVPLDYDGWMTFNFATPPTIVATTIYRLGWFNGGTSVYTYYVAGSNDQAGLKGKTYNDFEDPLEALVTWVDRACSIYATYVEENNPPTPPSGLQVDGKSNPTGANCISDLTPGLSAIFEDPDAGDLSNAIQIQVGSASGLSDMWDSGWLADSTVEGNRCTAKTYAGTALSIGTSYWWRCRFRDDDDAEGAWSEWQQFDMCAALNLVQMALI